MRFSSAMLIVPSQFKGIREYHTRPPVGIAYIAEALDQAGVNYTVIDMGLGYDVDQVIEKVKADKPRLVCLTAMTFGYKFVYDLIAKIKEAAPDAKIFAGGSHVWGIRSQIMLDCPGLDFAIPGEGEEIIQELCIGNPLEEIKGLFFRDGDEIRFTGEREFFNNYSTFQFPRYHNFELLKYGKFRKEITLQSSRGCPYKCTYCASGAAFGNKLRAKTAEYFVDEIEYWSGKGYKRIHICDDNFTLDIKRVFAICDEIEKRKIKVKFFIGGGIRADRLTRELLFRMKEVGFDTVAIPVEAGNNKVLASIKKGQSIEMVRERVKDACDAGLNVVLFFLIGSPGETWEDFMDSIKIAQEFPVADAKFYSIIPLPGTEMYNYLEKNNLFIKEPEDFMNNMISFDESPAFVTPEMNLEERVRAAKLAHEIREKILENHMKKHKLRYYAGKIKNRVMKIV